MKTNQIKLLTIAIFAFSVFAILMSTSNTAVQVKADGDPATDFKAKCSMCHSPKAEKNFDPTKAIDVLTNTILKGDTTKKPPMPGYEAKGMTAEQAKALAEYMVSLRTPAAATPPAAASTMSPISTLTAVRLDDDAATTYKAKCSMCHSPKAEKNFDSTKADDVLANTVMKGDATKKPPMPGYEAKGMTNDQAKALVAYMKSLKQ